MSMSHIQKGTSPMYSTTAFQFQPISLQPVLEEYKLTTDELIIHDNSHHDELTIQDTSCRNVISHPDDHDNSQYYSFEDSALHCDDTFDEIEVDSNIVSDCKQSTVSLYEDDEESERKPLTSSSQGLQTTHHATAMGTRYKAPFSAVTSSLRPSDPRILSKGTEVDEFGFVALPKETSYHANSRQSHQVLVDNPAAHLHWTAHLEFTQNKSVDELTWDKISPLIPKSDKVHCLIKQGIPHIMRCKLWPRISGSMSKSIKSNLSYKDILHNCWDEDTVTTRMIERDLVRTSTNNVFFQTINASGVNRLRNVLRAISWLFPDIGYCQGMGMVVSTLLLILEEGEVFWLLSCIIEDHLPSHYYNTNLFGIQVDQAVLVELVKQYLPDLHDHFEAHNVEINLITLNWFLTLYSAVLAPRITLRVWDCFLYEGSILLFRIALGVLSINKDLVLSQESSEGIFTELSNAPSHIEDVEQLIVHSYEITETLTDNVLQEMRTEAAAKLSSAVNALGTPYNPRPSEQARRLGEAKASWFSQWFGYGGSVSDKAKNIAQTEMLEDLRKNIAAIVKHFGGDTRLDVSPDYSFESHQRDIENFKEFSRNRPLRARALMDFERHDDDELGFFKNDIITVLNQKDEHCWFGEVGGVRGFFPAKFVLLLDERSKLYAIEGDDRVSNEITTLVRGNLCTALRKIFEHGLRRPSVLGTALHPWHFVEDSIDHEIKEQFTQILGRLVLCKTFRMDEEQKMLQPNEMLFRAMHLINASHDPLNISADVKLRSLICAGLNEQCLHMWFATFCQCTEVTERWYAPWSFIRSPAWFQIKCELRLLSKYAFNLSLDYEVNPSSHTEPVKQDVQDMLIKHHLFSWMS